MANDPDQAGQEEIDALLKQAQGDSAASASDMATQTKDPTGPQGGSADRTADADMEFLLNQAQEAIASVDAPTQSGGVGATPFQFHDFGGTPASSEKATLDLLRDVELGLRIELGRTEMYIEDVLKLRKGSVVPLDKLAGDPVDIFANGRLIARGEVLVLNDNFCVRVAELVTGDDLT